MGTLISADSYLLKPCRADKSYTLKLKNRHVNGTDLVQALLASSKFKLMAQTKLLSVLEYEGTLISVHIQGDMLLRQVQTREHANAIASKIIAIIGSISCE